jgi:hypothetical protein
MPRNTPYEPGAVEPEGPGRGLTIAAVVFSAFLIVVLGYMLLSAPDEARAPSTQVQSVPR